MTLILTFDLAVVTLTSKILSRNHKELYLELYITDTTMKVSRSLYCFDTSIFHGVENYFPRLWGTGISDAIVFVVKFPLSFPNHSCLFIITYTDCVIHKSFVPQDHNYFVLIPVNLVLYSLFQVFPHCSGGCVTFSCTSFSCT